MESAEETGRQNLSLLRGIESFARILAHISSIVVVGLMTLILYGVSMRYVFNRPSMIVDEFSGYAVVLIVFLAAGQTLLSGGHIRVDMLTSRLPARLRAWLREITLVLGAGYAAIMVWQAWALVTSSKAYSLKSMQLRVPQYIPQALILIGTATLLLTLIVVLVRQTQQLRQSTRSNE